MMATKNLRCLGLFLASFAAFALAVGYPNTARADEPASDSEQIVRLFETAEGQAALKQAGLSAEQVATMLSALSPGQRAALEEMIRDITPRAILRARLLDAGYTDDEIQERLALLTEAEITEFAGSPDATTGGTGVGTVILVVLLVFVAVLVAWYFVAVENPETGDEPVEPAPAPAG